MGVELLTNEASPALVNDGIEVESTFSDEVDNKAKTNVGEGLEEASQHALLNNSFGANGERKEGNHVAVDNFPKNATEEWPEAKQTYMFYFVKYRSCEDPKLKEKLDQADKEVQKRSQARFQITEALKAKRSERAQVIAQLKPLTSEDKQYRAIIDEKRKEMEPLQAALGKLRNANNAVREKGVGICSSEEELNDLIQSLHYRIQHESNTLVEEKRLLKEIKQLEGSRDKVIANAAMKAKLQDSLSQKEAIQDQVKLIGVGMDGVRKEQQNVRTKIKQLEEELKAIDSEINSLQEQLNSLTAKKDKAFENLNELRKAREELNACFYQNRSLLNNAKELAAKKDKKALQQLCYSEVEKFMSQWSSNKTFRDDYERRILPSLDNRQLSRDGRIRNPDEKLIIMVESSPPVIEPEAPLKVGGKREKEEGNSRNDNVAVRKMNDEEIPARKVKGEEIQKPTEESTGKVSAPQEKEYYSGSEKAKNVPVEMNAAKSKEMKREEEIAKAKSALERKKKLAEKAAARATAKAQKESEKKQKEKEKRAKKKSGASAPDAPAEEIEPDIKVDEPEETEVHTDIPTTPKIKEQPKDKVRLRNLSKGDRLPKAILRKKKTRSYWFWAAPAAVVALGLAVLAYYFSLSS